MPVRPVMPKRRTKEEEKRITEIRTRVREYYAHENDPYAYDPDEIDAVRALRSNALKDIEFLLALLPQA